jgi:GNAT superfamily N-acetyltransferase
MPEAQFRRMAGELRPFLDPELALLAEVDGEPVGFCVAVPDINQVLIHLNGRLFPLNWLRVGRLVKEIDVVSFKLMGVLKSYRLRGIDALLYTEILRGFVAGGYKWLDGSVTSEYNLMVNLAAQRLGAERYKHFRIYQMKL